MRAHYLQHVPFEGLGSIEGWLEKSGYEITCTKLYDGAALPSIDGVDMLIVMGGSMSVNDEAAYLWLVEEKDFIRRFVETGKPLLGICLGAQLIASALGGEVSSNAEKEIGWLPIHATNGDRCDVFQLPPVVGVFHWHGETFSLPEGATLTASSEGCVNQAFQIGANVIGLQFHLETTPATAQALVDNCRDDLGEGRYIQTEERILQVLEERYMAINSLMATILSYLHTQQRQPVIRPGDSANEKS